MSIFAYLTYLKLVKYFIYHKDTLLVILRMLCLLSLGYLACYPQDTLLTVFTFLCIPQETMNEKQSLETQLSEAKKQIDDLKLMNKAKYLSIQEKYDKLGNQLQQLISLHQELSIDLHN